MVIVQCVKDLSARFSGADEMHLTQSTQLMRDGGFGHAESIRNGADGHFPADEQRNDADAARVAEGTEEFG